MDIIPVRRDAQDEIYTLCMLLTEEFPSYITGLDDALSRYDNKIISETYENLNTDSVRQLPNGDLLNLEHHKVMNADMMRRDYEYFTILLNISKKKVTPYIFYTGDLHVEKVFHGNDLMFFRPEWIITKKINGNIKLNNIKYKIEKQLKLTTYEIFDLIWLPTFNINLSIDECIMEIISIYKSIIADSWLLDLLKRCLKLWVGRYLKNKNELKKAAEVLDVPLQKLVSFEEQYAGVLLANKLEQAEERGEKRGEERGRIKTALNLLNSGMSLEKVCEMTELTKEQIRNAK